MKRIFFIFFLVVWFGQNAMAQFNFDASKKAQEAIYLFRQQKFEGLMLRMSPEMKRYLDIEKLQGFWDGLEMQMGAVKSVGETKVKMRDTLAITQTIIQFEKQKIGFKLVYDKDAKICGMFLEAPIPKYTPAAYLDASNFYEIKRNLPDPKFPAEGIVTIPNKKQHLPVVIIVGGSGPTDKDLSIGPNRIYKDLAWGLANKGIVSYRYDKRTKAFGSAYIKNNTVTVKEEYLLDLLGALKVVKKIPEVDTNQIYILAHSEGGYLLPYFEKNLSNIAGYISFAGAYSNMADLLFMQLNYLQANAPKSQKKQYNDFIAKSVYMRDKINVNSPEDSLPAGLSAKYILFLNQNSPKNIGANLMQKKILFLQGGRDYQVPPSEMELWRTLLKENSQAQFELFPNLNHLGLPGKGPSLPAEYEEADNVPAELIDKVVSFILK